MAVRSSAMESERILEFSLTRKAGLEGGAGNCLKCCCKVGRVVRLETGDFWCRKHQGQHPMGRSEMKLVIIDEVNGIGFVTLVVGWMNEKIRRNQLKYRRVN